ncbi:DegV family protein [Salibacterium halotolerans]|uniref:EDD domain protein, DegV family n=1 Tax=Salibacterium halotolerans TaxID=1884432 RepID=A0A1I5WYC0_9BACI|nr:DegV family protein [Salibacterium halotolerans]SFQ24507.1 EDD domain protein, DegV family [Salibacterium halotolerans]
MTSTAIVTDSTAYLPKEEAEKAGITVLPLHVIFDGQAFQEEAEISTDAFYEKLRTASSMPTTSQPPPGLFIETFEKLAGQYDAVIVITLSSGISGTYQTAAAAGGEVEGLDVYVFDSEISCMPQGYFALEASAMACSGEHPETILERLDEMKQRTRAYFIVDDLNHLHRGGRLNGAQALVGSLLQIKPILHFDNRLIVPFEKVRTEKKAWNRVLQLFDEDARLGEPVRATVIHANRPEKAETLRRQLADTYPNVEVDTGWFGPVIGTHLGEGGLGIGWCRLPAGSRLLSQS